MPTELAKITVNAEGNILPLRRDLSQAEKLTRRSASQMDRSLKVVKRSFAGIGTALAGAISAATLGMITRNIIRTGTTFEHTMAIVGGVSRATAQEFKELEAIALKMGESTEWTSTQAAEALRYLSMAGFSASESIKALPGTLDLATAGNIDLGRAADIATNALTAMRLDVEELGRVNDAFVATITRTNTNMEMMADSFRYAAPRAAALGYSVERLSSMIGILGNAGIQASMAGTQLNFAMGRVDKAFEALGMDGSGKDLIDVLEAIKLAGWDAGKIMDVFGERGGRAALVMLNMTNDIRRLEDQIKTAKGEARRLADVMRSTLKGSFAELRSAVEAVGLDIFDVFKKDIQGAVKTTTQVIRSSKGEVVGYVSLYKEFIGLMNQQLGILGGIKQLWEAVNKLANLNAEASETQEDAAISFFGTLSDGLSSARQWYRDLQKDIEDATFKGLENIGKWAAALGRGVKDVEDFDAAVVNWGDSAVDMAEAGYDAFTNVVESAKGATGAIHSEYSKLQADLAAIGLQEAEIRKIIADLIGDIEQAKIDKLVNAFKEAREEASKFAEEWEKSVTESKIAQATEIDEAIIQGYYDTNTALLEMHRARIEEQKQLTADWARYEIEQARSVDDALVQGFADTEAALVKMKEAQKEATEKAAASVSGKLAPALTSVVMGTKSLKEAFTDMATSIVTNLVEMTIRQLIYNAALAIMSKYLGGGGGIIGKLFGFNEGAVVGYQTGAVVTQPSLFNIAQMAETGPEAIMPVNRGGGQYTVQAKTPEGLAQAPVTRIGGKLGVAFPEQALGESSQAKGISNYYYINAVDARSFHELVADNPEAIVDVTKNQLKLGDSELSSLIRLNAE